MSKINNDPRIDPRIKAIFGSVSFGGASDVESRKAAIANANSMKAKLTRQMVSGFLNRCDTEKIAPSAGLTITDKSFVSEPDGNQVKIQFIRPDTSDTLPCIYYIHGGGMATMSCYDGNYNAWVRIMAAKGRAVGMVHFRKVLVLSSAKEIGPYL